VDSTLVVGRRKWSKRSGVPRPGRSGRVPLHRLVPTSRNAEAKCAVRASPAWRPRPIGGRYRKSLLTQGALPRSTPTSSADRNVPSLPETVGQIHLGSGTAHRKRTRDRCPCDVPPRARRGRGTAASQSRPASEEVRGDVEELLEPRRHVVFGPHRNDTERVRGISEQDDLDRAILGQREMARASADALAHTSFSPAMLPSCRCTGNRARFLLATPQLIDEKEWVTTFA